MNIALVANFKAAYGGNFMAQMFALAKRLKAEGHNIIYIFPELALERNWCKEILQERKVFFVSNSDGLISAYIKLSKIVRNEKIDCLHTHFGYYDIPAAVITILHAHKKCIIHRHSESRAPANIIRKTLRYLKNRFLYAKVEVIAVSTNIYEEYIKYGFNHNHIEIIENGIGFKRLINEKSREDIRKQLSIGNDEKIFLMMGYNVKIKGVDTACKAFYNLHNGNDNVENTCLAIVVASHIEQVQDYVLKEYGCIPKWLYLLSPTENIGEYYCASDYFISASRTEGFPMALVEAIKMKLPIIISNIEGTKWAGQFHSVISFETGNSDCLLKRMREIVTKNYDQDVNFASEAVQKKYGLEKWTEAVISFYIRHRFI